MFETQPSAPERYSLAGLSSIGERPSQPDLYNQMLKRPIDVTLVLCFAIVFLPFCLLVSLALLIAQGRPILILTDVSDETGLGSDVSSSAVWCEMPTKCYSSISLRMLDPGPSGQKQGS